tara:strand:+ start:96653 stop:97561 length:909 start_codon:yes stop_codon:yes gene_type:complete
MKEFKALIKTLRPYKKIELNSENKLQFFLDKHSTKEGTWGCLELHEGEIDFIFLNGEGHELSRQLMNSKHATLLIPPASWHKIEPKSGEFNATLQFYCKPHRYFEKKYKLSSVHHDLNYVYQTYLSTYEKITMLDVGCGSGRNPLYFSMLGHLTTGIDINQNAINKTREIAEKEALSNIKLQVHDLNQLIPDFDDTFDFVYSTVALQFLNKASIHPLLTQLQNQTVMNGMHCLVFPIKSEIYSYPESFTYLAEPNELYQFYQDSGWSILEYREKPGQLHKLDETGKPKQGMFALLLAQKNNR